MAVPCLSPADDVGKHDLLGPDGWPLIGTFSGQLITEDECPTERIWRPAVEIPEIPESTMVLPRVPVDSPEDTALLPPISEVGDELAEERRRATDVAWNRSQNAVTPLNPRNRSDLQRLLDALNRWNPNRNRKD
ncbi:hypothetical protein GCM10027436_42370 [Actinophytocola sediminis]